MTRRPLSEDFELVGKAIEYSLLNLHATMDGGDVVAKIIQALDAQMIVGLLQCEPW